MGKKDLSALMSGIMGQPAEEQEVKQPSFEVEAETKTSGKRGRPKRENSTTRSSFIIDAELLKKIKYICVFDEITQTEALKDAMTAYIEKWERKNGAINLPDKK